MINHLDLFGGIGGFPQGLIQAGFKIGWHGYSEINKYAKIIHKKNFPNAEDLGDVKTIETNRLPDKIDIVTFGFPCQDFSIAGKRAGLDGNRSSLFYEAIRIIRAKKPKIFIFENVGGLFSSNQGRDFTTVLRKIANIGIYECQWQLINTSWFLPQNRKRIYFIGYFGEKPSPEVFPFRSSDKCFNEANTGKQENKKRTLSAEITSGSGSRQGERIYEITGNSCCLSANGGGKGANTGLYRVYDTYNNTYRIRRLSPEECELLQGFRVGWTEGLSDAQRYKLLGNAVTVNIIEEILRRLLYLWN